MKNDTNAVANVMKYRPYILAFAVWLFAAAQSGCTSNFHQNQKVHFQEESHFSGASQFEIDAESPLSAIGFDDDGVLYTLMQDSGRITAFGQDGKELQSFSRATSTERGRAEAVAMGVSEERVFTIDAKDSALLEWRKTGELVSKTVISYPISPGDFEFTKDGEILHGAEGFSHDSLVVMFDQDGRLAGYVGEAAEASDQLARTQSIRGELARGRVPNFMKNSVLVASGSAGAVYILRKTEPILQCYQDGALVFQRILDFPELADIRETNRIRNRVLESKSGYIPHSLWSDVCVDADGNIFILLSLQKKQTIYRLDAKGENPQKLVGRYGKGHLLAASKKRLAIADAGNRTVTIYSL